MRRFVVRLLLFSMIYLLSTVHSVYALHTYPHAVASDALTNGWFMDGALAAFSENAPIAQALDDLKGPPIGFGEATFAVGALAVGVRRGEYRFGALKRQSYYLSYSNSTLQYYAQDQNDRVMDGSVPVDLYYMQRSRQGLFIERNWQVDMQLTLHARLFGFRQSSFNEMTLQGTLNTQQGIQSGD